MSNSPTPISDRTIPVHKTDAEGVLIVNAYTGVIQQPLDERPEWADGLSTALLAERHGWYTQRLGAQYADEHKLPEAFNYADLGWIGLDSEGEAVELDADTDYRMEVLGEVLGLDREDGAFSKTTLAEVEVAMDRTRTEGEVAAFEGAKEQGFDSIRKDGTNG